jgi:hypothetical protein
MKQTRLGGARVDRAAGKCLRFTFALGAPSWWLQQDGGLHFLGIEGGLNGGGARGGSIRSAF